MSGVYAHGKKWRASVRIGGKLKQGESRLTQEEAVADRDAMLALQKKAKVDQKMIQN